MHVLITGGSSGIGLALARLYLAQGARVSLIARRPEGLEAARRTLTDGGACGVHVEAADATDRPALDAAVGACERVNGPVDLLIASAGVVEPGAFLTQTPETFDRQIQVNVIGVANAVRCVFASMVERRSGQLLLVSSGAGLIGCPGYAAYCASKAALVGLGEALDLEGAPFNVRVSLCFPPDTLTPQYRAELPKRPPEATRLMGRVRPWSAEKVARHIQRALERDRRTITFGFSLWGLRLFGPFVKPLLFRPLRK